MTAPFDDHELGELRRALGAIEARAPEAPGLGALSERPHVAGRPGLSRRPVVVAAGGAVLTLALLLPVGLWLRGGGGSPDASSTSLGTVSSSSVTEGTDATTAPPQSTTTSPEATTTVGAFLQITTVPERVAIDGLEVRINQPQVSHFDRLDSQERINDQLDAFVDSRRATYVPNPDPAGEAAVYGLDFEVLWLEEDAWPVLSIVYTETALPAGTSEASTRKVALMFDLVTGDPLTVNDMLTQAGVASLESMVSQRLADVFDGPFCCFEPGELAENVGVGPDGLVAYVDVSSFPRGGGPLEFLFDWAEVRDLIDMRQRFLAGFAVEAGRCSAAGEDWVLEDQPGLPEPVAAKRRAIFEAAAACDFDGLGALVPLNEPGSLWGFVGGRGGSAEAWRHSEASGDASVWFLLRTLNLSFGPEAFAYGEDQSLEWRGHVWPAVASDSESWSRLPADQRADLVDLYGDEVVASFAEHGSFNRYRVLIRDDGTWWYFGVQVA
ncbi:MAG: hypothetical protein KJ956_11450 [Actinobacteria bacterium]|nr:hypothetical protein [Actinomycetota bacterium]